MVGGLEHVLDGWHMVVPVAMRASAASHALNMSEVVVTSRVGRWWQRLVARRVWWHRRGGGRWVCGAAVCMAPRAHVCRLDEWSVHAQATSI